MSEYVENKTVELRSKAIRWVSFAFVLGIFVILILLKFFNDSFSWKWFIIITSVLLFLGIVLFFSNKLYSLIWTNSNQDSSDKKMLSKTDVEQIRDSALLNTTYFNCIRKVINSKQYITGEDSDKSIVYLYEVEPLYTDIGKENINFKIIINGHDDKKQPAVITEKIGDVELKRIITAVGGAKEQQFEVDSLRVFNPITNTVTESTSKKPIKKEDKKEKQGETLE